MVSLYTPEKHGTQILSEELKLEECRALLGDDAIDKVEEELELLEIAGLYRRRLSSRQSQPRVLGFGDDEFRGTPLQTLWRITRGLSAARKLRRQQPVQWDRL